MLEPSLNYDNDDKDDDDVIGDDDGDDDDDDDDDDKDGDDDKDMIFLFTCFSTVSATPHVQCTLEMMMMVMVMVTMMMMMEMMTKMVCMMEMMMAIACFSTVSATPHVHLGRTAGKDCMPLIIINYQMMRFKTVLKNKDEVLRKKFLSDTFDCDEIQRIKQRIYLLLFIKFLFTCFRHSILILKDENENHTKE